MLKTCSKCKYILDVNRFSVNKCKKDGLNSNCKDCHKIIRKKHYLLHKKKYIQKVKAYEDQLKTKA